jgi:EAL domain-containing protein (putative c-di-GMP-specific phosphodiesterase class I)/CHASE3 domain sensor protein
MLLFARRRLEIIVAVILLASISLTCALGALSYKSMVAYYLAHNRSISIIEQLRSLNTSLSTLQDAEIGQRGYLLTQDAAYLEPYTRAVSAWQENFKWLNRSFSTDPIYMDEMRKIQQLQVAKFAELEYTIQAARREGVPAALEIVRTDAGKKTMDRIRSIVAKIQRMKRVELTKLQSESTKRLSEGKIAILSFASGIGMFLLTVYFFLIYDLGDRRRLRSTGETAGSIDTATGIHNSHYLQKALANSLKHALRDKTSVALMMVRVRPSYGVRKDKAYHDAMNLATAQKLSEVMPAPHIAAYLGHGLFALLVYQFRDRAELGSTAARMCDTVTHDLIKAEPDRQIDIEVGISVYPEDANTPALLMEKARLALLNPPHGRVGRYNFFQQADLKNISRAELLSQGLHNALKNDNFNVVYQPQVNLATKEIIGAEALIRWEHPSLGPISPDEFIPLAERTGLILPIGLLVLKRACHDAAEWNRQGINIRVAVNVCALQLSNLSFLSAAKLFLEESGLPPSRLEIELTERVMMDPIVGKLLLKFRALGVHIAIDDFGTGYSSLNYLSNFPADVLKIDRSFIESVPDDPKNSGVVRTIINIGRELGMTTIAEGIENQDQELFLIRNGCNTGQGYLFHRPINADKIPELFRIFKSSRADDNTSDLSL